jgi:transcriptional regulator with XRE-family HTH domain
LELHEIIRARRSELGLSQADLASQVGVDRRQVRRYESGETQPTLGVAREIARALGISIDELAGNESRRIDLSGEWFAVWQSWKGREESIRLHRVRARQRGDVVEIAAIARGAALEEGGYLRRGELRIFDNEALIGWYAADEGAVRSKGSLYYALHPHGLTAKGRWVGLSFDGPAVTGLATLARTEDEAQTLMEELRTTEGTNNA